MNIYHDDLLTPTHNPQHTPDNNTQQLTNNIATKSTKAHYGPRIWEAVKKQIIAFFDIKSPGKVINFCGEAPCTKTQSDAVDN